MLQVVNILRMYKPAYGLIAIPTLQFTFLWFPVIITLAIKDIHIVYLYINIYIYILLQLCMNHTNKCTFIQWCVDGFGRSSPVTSS